jgi:hypothetical protein
VEVYDLKDRIMAFNATLNNISVISWRHDITEILFKVALNTIILSFKS